MINKKQSLLDCNKYIKTAEDVRNGIFRSVISSSLIENIYITKNLKLPINKRIKCTKPITKQ